MRKSISLVLIFLLSGLFYSGILIFSEEIGEKPILSVLDFETSGIRIDACRIVQMAFIKFSLDSKDMLREENLTVLVNPKVKIEEGASKINGIYDADVENSDTFADHWNTIRSFLQGTIAVGYNSNDFDNKPSICDNICLSVKCLLAIAPLGQA